MNGDSRFHPVLRFLRRLPGPRGAADPSDGELLARFAGRRDEAAFALLVDRYGSLVLGLCRRVLRNHHDAEDAFQATFLVLARKAGSIRRPHLLGNWLYGVAYRTALKARADAARRRNREQAAPSRREAPPATEMAEAELKRVLDEEVSRLPEKYRTAFVLCCLQGWTNEEAARQLGCPVWTVQSRLARARQQLRSRLVRRGVTLAAGAWSAISSRETAAAVVPGVLREDVVTTAAAAKDAAGMVLNSRIALAQGVLQTMFLTKLKIAGVAILMLSLVAVSAGLLAFRTQAQPVDETASATPPPVKAAPKEAAIRLQALLKERLNAARTEWDARMREFLTGLGTLEFLFGASQRLVKAQRAMSDRKEDLLTALEDHVKRMKKVEEIEKKRFDEGRIPIYVLAESTYYRAEAEIQLERAKAK